MGLDAERATDEPRETTLARLREVLDIGVLGTGFDDMGDAYRYYERVFDWEVVNALVVVAEAATDSIQGRYGPGRSLERLRVALKSLDVEATLTLNETARAS